jgi:hypothetical protein
LETQTLSLALDAASRTGALVFAPIIAALPFVRAGKLVEVAVKGWHVADPLYLACHGDRVPAKVQRVIEEELDLVLREQ